MSLALQIIAIIIISYLLGSIPTAYLMARYIRKINVFDVGSGNMGGTNVARAMGLHWGILTAILDALKGVFAVYIAQTNILPEQPVLAAVVAAIAAISGHNWSLFASMLYSYYYKKFSIRGGKGAATAMGTMLMLLPNITMIAMLAIGIGLAFLFRYASLAVLVSFSFALIWGLIWALAEFDGIERTSYIVYVVAVFGLIGWRFRENIQRLIAGNERKLGERVA